MYDHSQIIVGDALNVLQRLPDNSMDCCVTSPPYYGLRDYGVDGQIGLEDSPEEYIDRLVGVFREVRRVLKDDGTLWLNIADSYAGSGKGAWSRKDAQKEVYVPDPESAITKMPKVFDGIKPKDMIGIPWMLAFALRADGWYLRQDIIWQKPNCMPESVTDRFTKSYEHIFLLSKSKQYYFDWKSVQEPAVGFDVSSPRGSKGCLKPNAGRRKGNAKTFRGGGVYTSGKSFGNNTLSERDSHGNAPNETGLRRRRDVWSVSTRGYKGAHFATFPPELIEPCILAGSREGGTVLDPFFGSGTAGVVAKKFGRYFVGIEINPEYARQAEERSANKT